MDDQEDTQEREPGQGHQPTARLLPRRVLAQELGVVLAGEIQLLDRLRDFAGHAPQVPAGHVAGHVDPPRGPLAFDLVGRRHQGDLGDVRERHVRPQGGLDRQRAEFGHVVANLLGPPDEHVEDLLLAVQLADLQALDQGGRRASDVAGGQPEPRRGFRAQPHVQLGDQQLRLDLQVRHPRNGLHHLGHLLRLARRTVMSGPKSRTTTVAPAPVKTSLIRSFK